MRRVGFIPVREGSKRIPHKNRKEIAGKPLYSWVTESALKSELDWVVIYTDDTKLARDAYDRFNDYTSSKLLILPRPAKTAVDDASTEDAIEEFTDYIDWGFDEFYLLQATSPYLTKKDINSCIKLLNYDGYKSIVTVSEQDRFLWEEVKEIGWRPRNYNVSDRPLSQSMEDGELYIENGALYGSTKEVIQEGIRVSKEPEDIVLYVMPDYKYHEIDTSYDFAIVEAILEKMNEDENNNE